MCSNALMVGDNVFFSFFLAFFLPCLQCFLIIDVCYDGFILFVCAFYCCRCGVVLSCLGSEGCVGVEAVVCGER